MLDTKLSWSGPDTRWLVVLAVVGLVAGHPCSATAGEPGVDEQPRWLLPTLHSAGLTFAIRLGSSALWPKTFDIRQVDRNSSTFANSWSSAPTFDTGERFFEWDHDPWTINIIGHGLMGSEYYLAHRRARHSWWLSLTMTLAWCFVWEYLIESWHKHPSGVDLLWTPVGGMLFGEGRYQVHLLLRRMRPSVGRHVLLYLIDPIGQLERDLFCLEY